MGTQANLLSAREAGEWCAQFARWAEEREGELGHAVPNCPTAGELWRVVEIISEIHADDESRTTKQVNDYLRELAGISDKWLDPDNDPIGVRLHPAIEAVIEGLRQCLEAALPEQVQSLRTWGNLRPAAQLSDERFISEASDHLS